LRGHAENGLITYLAISDEFCQYHQLLLEHIIFLVALAMPRLNTNEFRNSIEFKICMHTTFYTEFYAVYAQ
jgi:hypothetical protein